MSEQATRRLWIATRAHDRATGEWLTVKGEVVPAVDYDALQSRLDAAERELRLMESDRDSQLRIVEMTKRILGQKLAERDALLLLIKKQPGLNEIHRARINTLLSSAGPVKGEKP